MLYLSRKLGESIIINNTIELQVIEVKGKSVKLGFTFPQMPACYAKKSSIKLVLKTWPLVHRMRLVWMTCFQR